MNEWIAPYYFICILGTSIIFSPTVTAIAPEEEKGKGVGVYFRLGFGIVN